MSTQQSTNHHTNLEPTEYFLLKLVEEAAEVIQAVSKIRRFGPDNHHPERTQTNRQELVGEVEDFLAALAAIEQTGFFDLNNSTHNIARKLQNLLRP